MSIRNCFTGKMASGQVATEPGERILKTLDELTRERDAKHAALHAAAIGKADARRKADIYYQQTIAQVNVLRAFHNYNAAVADLRATPGSLGFGNKAPPTLGKETKSTLGFALRSLLARDPWEIATWTNVAALSTQLRGEAHRVLADTIEALRPKKFGFAPETTKELELLRAGYGASSDPNAATMFRAWTAANTRLADDFIAAGGELAKREDYFPNPEFDGAKVKALGEERFKQLVRDNVDRERVIDFRTDTPMTNGRFERLLDDAWRAIAGFGEGIPTAAGKRALMTANERAAPRLFQWRDAEAWMRVAETVGRHASPYESMMAHVSGMANDTAMMRVLGPNPDATMKFMGALLDREAARLRVEAKGDTPAELAAATRQNRAIEQRVAVERKVVDALYAEVSGANNSAVNMTLAQGVGDMRHWLAGTQLGSAVISSLTDPVLLAMTSRFNGLPVMGVLGRAVELMKMKGADVFVAQQGVVMDTLAHAAGSTDKLLGENIRTGVAAKVSNANIRISGLRRWTAVLRGAFALEMMGFVARSREVAYGDLDVTFRAALGRYGIGEADWDTIRAATPHQPRPNALFTRPADIADSVAAEKLARLINTEMNYAVIEGDPLTRALLLGESRPGTVGGEVRRSVTQYRTFPAAVLTMHLARALARGWDGQRLAHGAFTFIAMTAFGALAMQAKEIASGRDPLSLDPTEANGLRGWAKATLQGGGLGVFGDLVFVDQTKYGNTWAATAAGPIAGSVERLLGDFLIKNIQKAGKGEQTHFTGDALYALAGHMPGSSLWFGRLVFQREILDQLALLADPRTRERFARIETTARKEWGQSYWWRPGRREPERAPDFSAIGGPE